MVRLKSPGRRAGNGFCLWHRLSACIGITPYRTKRHRHDNSGVKNKKIKNASGAEVLIKKDSDLHSVGATYSVNKLLSDPPHWSDNGF